MGNLEGWQEVIEESEKDENMNSDLIELYRKINVILDTIDDKFQVTGSGIGINCIDFGIVIPIGKELPEKISMLFFNLDPGFKLKVREDPEIYKNMNEYYYNFEITNK